VTNELKFEQHLLTKDESIVGLREQRIQEGVILSHQLEKD